MNLQDQIQAALALHNQGKLEEAEKIYRDVLRLDPGNFDALHLMGVLAYHNGRFEQAVDLISRAIRSNPAVPFAYANRGNALKALNRPGEALASYTRAAQLGPEDADIHFSLGMTLQEMGRLNDAVASYDRAVALKPDFAEAHNNRGNALKGLGRTEDAAASFAKAIACQPGFAELYNNLGTALHDLKRFDDAVSNFGSAIRLKPGYAEAHYNRGLSLKALQRFEEAIASFAAASQAKPGYTDAILNKSYVELLTTNFAEGWKGYESRLQRVLDGTPRLTALAQAAGKTVLVHWEQGLGDTIQFCRYAGLLQERGATVLFAPQSSLKSLLASLGGGIELVDDRNPGRAFDFHIPLLSLPGLFGTALDAIPARQCYLSADPARIERWKEKMGRGGFKIGICWKGSSVHTENLSRFFGVELFQQWTSIPNVRLISLLKNEGSLPAGIETLEGLDAGADAFVDTAAVMMNLDLVITADTSIAHLAGALGVPVWVALKHVPDWRWLVGRTDSPWYPSMRLFRQEANGDWKSVFRQMETALTALQSGRTA